MKLLEGDYFKLNVAWYTWWVKQVKARSQTFDTKQCLRSRAERRSGLGGAPNVDGGRDVCLDFQASSFR